MYIGTIYMFTAALWVLYFTDLENAVTYIL